MTPVRAVERIAKGGSDAAGPVDGDHIGQPAYALE